MNSGFGETFSPSAARWPRYAGGGGSRFPFPTGFLPARPLSTLPGGWAGGSALPPGPAAWMPREGHLPHSPPGSTSGIGQGLPPALLRGKSMFCKPQRESACRVPGSCPPGGGGVQGTAAAGPQPRERPQARARCTLLRQAPGPVRSLVCAVSPWHHTYSPQLRNSHAGTGGYHFANENPMCLIPSAQLLP